MSVPYIYRLRSSGVVLSTVVTQSLDTTVSRTVFHARNDRNGDDKYDFAAHVGAVRCAEARHRMERNQFQGWKQSYIGQCVGKGDVWTSVRHYGTFGVGQVLVAQRIGGAVDSFHHQQDFRQHYG